LKLVDVESGPDGGRSELSATRCPRRGRMLGAVVGVEDMVTALALQQQREDDDLAVDLVRPGRQRWDGGQATILKARQRSEMREGKLARREAMAN
jgi:hypothetical protein